MPANMIDTTMVNNVAFTGVWVLSFTSPNTAGNILSKDMPNMLREQTMKLPRTNVMGQNHQAARTCRIGTVVKLDEKTGIEGVNM
jgi:hypothetical protein